jgi:hypothetical protein
VKKQAGEFERYALVINWPEEELRKDAKRQIEVKT